MTLKVIKSDLKIISVCESLPLTHFVSVIHNILKLAVHVHFVTKKSFEQGQF
jgi:hypothetical protein